MNVIVDEQALQTILKDIDEKIEKLNDQKIIAFLNAVGLKQEDLPKNYINWENIFIVVPDRYTSNEIKKYKYSISRIHFGINPNAQQIHIYDFNEWKNATRNKTQFQIRKFLKTNFGGEKKNHINPE